MGRLADRPARSHSRNQQQQQSNTATMEHAQTVGTRRNAEQQSRLEKRAALKASFGTNASQLVVTVYILLAVALCLTAFAFFSSKWLEVERRYYGSKFRKLGLWRMCFNSFSAPDDHQFKKFYVGCRWIFADEYKPIRRFLLPGSLKTS